MCFGACNLVLMSDDNNQKEPIIDQLQKDLDQMTNSWKRALADFENFKKQKEKENKELLEFAKEVTVVKLLPTIDTLEQALHHMPEYTTPSAGADTPPILGGEEKESPPSIGGVPREAGGGGSDFGEKYKNWQAGINGILSQLDKTLAELGIKKIEAIGKKFDPNFHEAVKEVAGVAEDGSIVDELQAGFILNNKVIRPSQVVINKKIKTNDHPEESATRDL